MWLFKIIKILKKGKGVLGENPFDFNIRFLKYFTNNKEIWAKQYY